MSYVMTIINNSHCFFGASGVGDYLLPWIPITIDNNENVVRSKYCIIGYEPGGLTVHPPPPNDRGWVHFFRMGV